MSLLPPATTAMIRQQVAGYLADPDGSGPQQGVIRTPTFVQGSTGASKPTWAESAPLNCAVHRHDARPAEVLTADELRAVQQWILVFAAPLPPGVSITARSEIRIVGGPIFQVLSDDAVKSLSMEVQVRCIKVG